MLSCSQYLFFLILSFNRLDGIACFIGCLGFERQPWCRWLCHWVKEHKKSFDWARIRQMLGRRIHNSMSFLLFVMPSLINVFPTGPPRCMLPERSRGERYSITGFAGNIFDEGLPIGERVSITVRCNSGYTAQPAVQTACLDLERGVWSVAVPICGKPDYSNYKKYMVSLWLLV